MCTERCQESCADAPDKLVVVSGECDSGISSRKDGSWIADERYRDSRVAYKSRRLVRPRLTCDDAVEPHCTLGEKGFRRAKEIRYVGTPVREAFFHTSKARARQRLGVGRDFMILSFGGSLGAQRLNEACLNLMMKYSAKSNIIHIHATGKRYFEKMDEIYHFSLLSDTKCKAVSFIDGMEDYLAAADIVICRSGAATISEILASGTYPIFVPSPNVKNNHQFHNAKAIATLTGAKILEEGDDLYERLEKEVRYMREHPMEMRKICQKLRSLSTPSCAKGILQAVRSYVTDM